MEDQELRALTEAFKGYRDLLMPVQESLKDMVETYDAMHDDLERLNGSFDGSVHSKLDKIYDTLAGQAKKSSDLSTCIDAFLKNGERYNTQISSAITAFSKAQEKLQAIGELESKAREQLKKLDEILEEKKINYNIKELQRSLENYNANVQRVSDYINKEVASALQSNGKEIEKIRQENEKISSRLEAEHSDIASLVEAVKAESELLKRAVEKEDVNEAYLFDAFDRWAISRHVKIKE